VRDNSTSIEKQIALTSAARKWMRDLQEELEPNSPTRKAKRVRQRNTSQYRAYLRNYRRRNRQKFRTYEDKKRVLVAAFKTFLTQEQENANANTNQTWEAWSNAAVMEPQQPEGRA
jgi:hypothetical protein